MSEAEAGPPSAPLAPDKGKPAADLPAQARKEASWALFALAGLPLAFTTLAVLLPRFLGATVEPGETTQALALGYAIGFAVAFAGLGVWARFRPLPPAILGLALYVVFAARNIAVGLVLILLAALLVKSIHTSLKARRR